ncbi:MAG TPA: hypothetical protein VE573_09880 [Nitrososphaeraceae archaeon]|nr:hypothetical protein [Nitrososphaeraceae archaeon]
MNRNDNNKIRQEILDSGYDELTDKEHDHQQYLKELIQSGVLCVIPNYAG